MISACAAAGGGAAEGACRGDKTLSEEINRPDLSEIIAESFGANATYVEGLLGRYHSNPALVDEAWRAYFAELLGDGAPATMAGGNGAAAAADNGQAAAQTQAEAPA